MKYCTVNIANWGNVSPCLTIKVDSINERLNVWKCKVNQFGKIVSSRLIQSNLYTIDQIDSKKLKTLFLNDSDAKRHAINLLN